MPMKKCPQFDSHTLRKLAEDTVDRLADDFEIYTSERAELVTSLVRQWVTYDGRAALFLRGPHLSYLDVGQTPLGNPLANRTLASTNWFERVAEDWNVELEAFGDAFEQLNRGQSAEVVTRDGVPLRLSVNPAERRCAVEPLAPAPPPPGGVKSLLDIATDHLVDLLGDALGDDELASLAGSIVRQWHTFEGHASFFLDGQQLIVITIREHAGGKDVTVSKRPADIDGLLMSLGFSGTDIPGVLARLNLGQSVEFLHPDGEPSRLWHDPKMCRVRCRPLAAEAPAAIPMARLASCPKCSAFLGPTADGTPLMACPLCGHSLA